MTLQELQERRQKLAKEIREHADKFAAQGQKWTDAEQRGNWEKLNADYNANKAQLDAANDAAAVASSAAAIDAEMRERQNPGQPIPGQEDTSTRDKPIGDQAKFDPKVNDLALRGFIARQMGWDVDENRQAEYRRAMHACGIEPWQTEIRLKLADNSLCQGMANDWRSGHPSTGAMRAEMNFEKRAQSGSFFGAGGGLVFPSMIRRLEINMLAFGGMRQVATTIVTTGGEETGMPTADDTFNEGSIIGENQSVGTDTVPAVGMRKWGAWTFTSKPVLVPYSLLQDSAFDLGAMLGDMLGERLGRATNRKFTKGNGISEPNGIITAAATTVSSGTSGAITYDDIVKLQHSVDPAYRSGAQYMCHDTTLLAVRLLKDSQNRPLWTSGTDTNSFDRLNFIPLVINQHMDAGTTTGNKSLLFGQLSKYFIRRAGVARFYRLQERYRDSDQDGFIMLIREDGNLLNAGTPPVKYLLQS